MEENERVAILDELIHNADRRKELELKRLEIKQEQQPIVEEYREIQYRYLTDVESANDARSRELYADEIRKEKEVDHRLRIDRRAKELISQLRQFDVEYKKMEIEIDNLDEKRIPLMAKAGIYLPASVKRALEEEKAEDEDTP